MQFSRFAEQAVIKCPEVKGAENFLKKYYKKIELFVASGTPGKELTDVIKKRKLRKYFAGIYGSPLDKTSILKKITGKYEYHSAEVVLVGDAINDYQAAREAGVKFIARVEKGGKNPFKGLAGIGGLIYDINGLEKSIRKLYPDFK